MKPSAADLELYQGDTYAATVTVTGAPVTGFVPLAQIRTAPADDAPTVAATFTTAVTGPQTISLSLTAAETVGLAGGYLWDLQVDNGGVVTTILAGKVKVTPEVSRLP